MLIAVCIKAVVSPHTHTVWPIFVAGARHWWEGQSLYAPYPGLDLFRYSPTFAVLLTPVLFLPIWLSGIIWGALNVLLVFASLHVLQNRVFPHALKSDWKGLYFILVLLGIIEMVWNLQSNGLIFALLVFGVAAMAGQRWWWAAFFLAAPVFVKPWVLALTMLIIPFWPRQLAGRFALAFTAFALIPFLAAPPATVLQHYQDWHLALNESQFTRWPGYRDAWTIWETLGFWGDPKVYRFVQLGTGLVIFGLCLAYRFRSPSRRQLLTFVLGIWACWQLLFGPGSEVATYGLICPMLCWSLVGALIEKRRSVGLSLAYAIFLAFSIFSNLFSWLPGNQAGLPVSVALFAGCLVVQTFRRNAEMLASSSEQGLLPTPISNPRGVAEFHEHHFRAATGIGD